MGEKAGGKCFSHAPGGGGGGTNFFNTGAFSHIEGGGKSLRLAEWWEIQNILGSFNKSAWSFNQAECGRNRFLPFKGRGGGIPFT